jgi:hypothetical protein
LARDYGIKLKSIKDGTYLPTSQNLGTFVDESEDNADHEVFAKLARGCVVEGNDRKKICAANAKVRPLLIS